MPDQPEPQPISDVSTPPPGETTPRPRWNIPWLVVVGFGLLLILIALPLIMNGRRGREKGMTPVINNARQIGIALFEFQTEYGKFPDATTVAEVKRKSGTPLTLAGNFSNDYFAQLIVSGICQSESMFHAKAKGAVKPDGVMDTDASVLSHGEYGFAYIAGLDASSNPSTPIAFGPIIPGTKTLDTKSNDGKAVILRLDISVGSLHINSAGRIIYLGQDLLDPTNPIWGGKAPDVKWPK